MKKVCTKCGVEKGLESFCKSKSGKFGVAAECKPCKNHYDKNRKYIPDTEKYPSGFKECTQCSETLSLENYTFRDREQGARLSYCKHCDKKFRNMYKDSLVSDKHTYPEGVKECYTCEELLPLDEFSFWQKEKEVRENVCKSCDKIYRDSPEVREMKRISNKALHNRNLDFIYNYLSANPCERCGEDDVRLLEFHHTGHKNNNVGSLIPSSSIETLKLEIELTSVMCVSCHRLETFRTHKKDVDDLSGYGSHRKKRNRIFVDKVKSESPCTECGESNIDLIDFHHPGEKNHNISHLVAAGRNLDLIIEELKLTITLCVSCYRKETLKEINAYKHVRHMEVN